MGKLFGTDGIRGTANKYPMTVDIVSLVGKAASIVLSKNLKITPTFIVGKDTRLSGYAFENALSAGLLAGGSNVLLTGPIPTPGIAYLTISLRASSGVVISASHNPYTDNGIKFFNSNGYKLSDELENEIEEMVLSGQVKEASVKPEKMGKARRITDARGRYIEFLKSTFPRDLSMYGLKIAVDCANGATYKIAPVVFSELGADVKEFGVSPDGKNINGGCGATVPEFISRKTIEVGADIGVSFDGDGDRVILVDENGDIYDGDYILAISTLHLMERKQLKRNLIVGTEMTNTGLEKFLNSMGISLVRTKVGDRYVAEELIRTGANLGGESSGHIIFHDFTTTGDGIITALQVISFLIRKNISLSKMRNIFNPFPRFMENIQVTEKVPLNKIEGYEEMLKNCQKALEEKGRIVVRYSGTEPLLRVMVECEDEEKGRNIFNELSGFLKTRIQGVK
uniref:Phosphoglucosamine mutase n=1 Tax=uncultured prokaryote TaxID=198431 RepID=H5SPX2_9ZZZZ|nr:phosphoglucosamine mutase [uncultured prokaryote]